MQDKQDTRIRRERMLREKAARVRFGSCEFKKKGVSRFDLRDPYHLAIALTWPQFLAALFALYLAVNVAVAALFWLVPGSVVNARPGSFADLLILQPRDTGDGRLWRNVSGDALWPCRRGRRDRLRARLRRQSGGIHA
jgi:hypothetical protein